MTVAAAPDEPRPGEPFPASAHEDALDRLSASIGSIARTPDLGEDQLHGTGQAEGVELTQEIDGVGGAPGQANRAVPDIVVRIEGHVTLSGKIELTLDKYASGEGFTVKLDNFSPKNPAADGLHD